MSALAPLFRDLGRTLRVVAEKAGWGREMGPGKGLGIAFHFDHRGHTAHVAEVSVDGSQYSLDKMYVAVDIGPILNMSGARNQVEGAVIDGLSTTRLETTAPISTCRSGT